MDKIVININSKKDYSLLYEIIRENNIFSDVDIYYSLQIIEPIDVLILTQFVIFLKNKNSLVTLFIENEIVKLYLDDIGFFNFCIKNYKEPTTISWIPSQTAMPIRRVDKSNMNEYINSTVKYLRGICEGKDLAMLNLCLAEMLNNVYDHSKSRIGAYVFCQYYRKSNEIKIAVTDLGIGIPTSINQYLASKNLTLKTPVNCIKWSIQENKSTQSHPHNRGLGLSTINKFVSSNLGNWKLRSNEVLLKGYYYGNRYSINDIYNFVGTTIEITIKVDNLDIESIEEAFYWDN